MEYNEFSSILNTVFRHNGIDEPSCEEESRMFYNLAQRLLEVNQKMNLTAIREEKGVILRHFADSLTVLPFLPQNASVLDVGCGGGFPSLPIAIRRQDISVTSVDSTEKKINYVNETAKMLGLNNLTAFSGRAEDLAHTELRESFDVVTARAVAALPILTELCLPFVKEGGSMIAMKAAKGEEELSAALNGIKKLGGQVVAAHPVTLRADGEEDSRLLIEIKKISKTPAEYPRQYAKIQKHPL